MSLFMLTSKILDESSFLKFISRINEEFIRKAEEEYEAYLAAGKGFDLNQKKWLARCKDESLREDNGVMVSFKIFALDRVNALMNVDMDLYLKSFREGNLKDREAFLTQLADVMQQISRQEYLKPISAELMLRLTKIRAEVEGMGSAQMTDDAKEGSDFLVWNGSLEQLCAVFNNLSTSAKGSAAQSHLKYSAAQLATFISRHFRPADGNSFSDAAVKDCLGGSAK